jgi:hypothetical protein
VHNKKTLELLLINYNNINNDLRKPCEEKSKFEKLIKEVQEALKKARDPIVYKDNMNALEFAKHLATEANERNNNR